MSKVKLSTNHGDIVLELNAEKAPLTVANFIEYVNAGHYENTVFHRVIGNFMIQGGGFEPGMKEKKDKRPSIQNEADNGLPNEKVHRCHGPYHGAAFGFRAVFHQRGGQQLPEPQQQDHPGLGLRSIRQSG